MSIGDQLVRFLRPFIDKFPKVAFAYRFNKDNLWPIIQEPKEKQQVFKFTGNEKMEQG